MTAPCGFGYDGECCCGCLNRLIAKPKCHHLGGKGRCGSAKLGALGELAVAAEPEEFVCLAYASEGIAMTDWDEHGCCEMWMPKNES